MPKLRPANAEAQKALASGVRYEVVAPGTGPAATARHALAFRYAVFRADGTLIECTEQTGQRIAGSLASLPYAFLKEIAVGCRQGDVLRVEVPKKEVPQAPTDTVWELELVGLSALPEVPQFRLPDAAKVVTTQSGLKYEVIEPGTGSSPTAADSVVAHYTGWLTDGKVFDSSHERGSPSTFPLRRVIPGWTEGLQLMKTGGKFLFEIPGPLAYGAAGQPPMIPANCTLVFLVELIEVKSAKAR
ncbi:MAG: FKBP-type peptidyl-prolyl cis-trans isomerase [Planctomycetes bacterium]|nr:FKBP-type peptidyl-prolyl cis-trans isomerase [Planctomycetota bacterium]